MRVVTPVPAVLWVYLVCSCGGRAPLLGSIWGCLSLLVFLLDSRVFSRRCRMRGSVRDLQNCARPLSRRGTDHAQRTCVRFRDGLCERPGEWGARSSSVDRRSSIKFRTDCEPGTR